jgi:hypothetical protein
MQRPNQQQEHSEDAVRDCDCFFIGVTRAKRLLLRLWEESIVCHERFACRRCGARRRAENSCVRRRKLGALLVYAPLTSVENPAMRVNRRSGLELGLLYLAVGVVCLTSAGAQQPSPSPTPVVFSLQTLAELRQLQSAALASDYAYRQTAYLSNNIGPRLSGSAQEKRAVEYVAGELRALGLDVRLEKVMVPHWVRGEETGALVKFPGQAPETTQKIVLTALGGSVATPPKESRPTS